MSTTTLKQPTASATPANEQQRAWVSGGAQPKANSRAVRQAAKEREHQRRQDVAELLPLRWEARYRQSRATDPATKDAWRDLVALLSTVPSVQAARVQLVAVGPSGGHTAALLDALLADDDDHATGK